MGPQALDPNEKGPLNPPPAAATSGPMSLPGGHPPTPRGSSRAFGRSSVVGVSESFSVRVLYGVGMFWVEGLHRAWV